MTNFWHYTRNIGLVPIIPSPSNSLSRRIPLARIALATLVVALVVQGFLSRGTSMLEIPIWELQQTSSLKGLIMGLGISAAVTFLVYAAFGFLAVRLFTKRPVFLTVVASLGLSAIVSMIAAGPGWNWPNLIDMLLPGIAAVFGAWIGKSWLAGGRVRKSMVPKIMLFGTTSLALLVVLILSAIESEPLDIRPAEVTSADRVRLTQLIRSKSPRTIPEGETVTLSLTQRDANILLAWGLSLGSENRLARVALKDEVSSLRASLQLPAGRRLPRYLNLVVSGSVGVTNGVLEMQIHDLRIGRIKVPRLLLRVLSGGIARKIQQEPLAVPILAQIQRAGIAGGNVSATYRRIDMPEGFRDDVFGSIGPLAQVNEALVAQFGLVAAASAPTFESAMQNAFRLAQTRSRSRDPVVENRAAIIALGISFGHRRIAEFAGTIPHTSMPSVSAAQMRQVQLWGRWDWSRHFFVSAATEVLSTELLSHDVGLLKEELDSARNGGSGFSFADLAADRAGTLFGKVATRDDQSARLIQQRLVTAIDVRHVFPDVSDLPENLSQQQLSLQYGGTNGAAYRHLLQNIDARISAVALYDGLRLPN